MNADELCHSGIALYEQGRYQDALDVFDEGLSREPHSALAHNGRGPMLFQIGQSDVAMEEFNEAIRLDRGYHTPYANRSS